MVPLLQRLDVGAGLVELETAPLRVIDQTLPLMRARHRCGAFEGVHLLGELGGHRFEMGDERDRLPTGHVVVRSI